MLPHPTRSVMGVGLRTGGKEEVPDVPQNSRTSTCGSSVQVRLWVDDVCRWITGGKPGSPYV